MISKDNQHLNGLGSSSGKQHEKMSTQQQNGYSKNLSPGSSSGNKVKAIKLGSPDEPKSSSALSFAEVLAKSSSATRTKHHLKKEVKQEPLTPMKKSLSSDSENQSYSRDRGEGNRSMNNGDDEDDIPLTERMAKQVKQEPTSQPESKHKTKKRKAEEESDGHDNEDDVPLAERSKKSKKNKSDPDSARKRKHEDDDAKSKPKEKKVKTEPDSSPKKGGRKSKENSNEEETKWKWWEEQKKDEGVKWKTLEHKGPVFAPLYERLPASVHFYYEGKHIVLSDEAEEVAGFYARMLDHDYTTRDLFNKNFFKDWRKVMNSEEKNLITDLKKCNFKEMYDYFKIKTEERKNMTKEEKHELKKANEKTVSEYGFCIVDGHKQKIGNFKIEPPGLFRGRGDHPKQGMLKRRVRPEDVIINCSKGPNVPSPPPGHKWKEVRHDNTVTWLASWSENIQGSIKYVMLNAASRLKGEKDWMKYETARKLHKHIDKIRANYYEDFKCKEMKIRQRATALYFIDKLALRAGNEKDEDTADTVGCCSLRVEHVKLHDHHDGKEHVVEFDFLGKDSIRYTNAVAVEKRVFKNLQLFLENKQPGDDLFDRLNTTILNKHLQSLMDGLSAKVFRTYNASRTLQEQLDALTNGDDPLPTKLLSYNRANRQVAILCNHQRAAPKNFEKQMENLQAKVDAKKVQVKAAKKELKDAKADYKAKKSEAAKVAMEKKKKTYDKLADQLTKLEAQQTDKDENKEIALSTSKLNYLDPRISIAWCKKWNIPIEKIYNKTQREKFAWAIDMAEADYHF